MTMNSNSISLVTIGLLAAFASRGALAAPVRVDFVGTVTSSAGVLAGTAGQISGHFIYEPDSVPAQTSPAVYWFTGPPYGLDASVPTLGHIASGSIYAVVGDNGSNTPYDLIDQFALGALHIDTPTINDIFVEMYWSGPTSSFEGDEVPSIAELMALRGHFGVWKHGEPGLLLRATVSAEFTTVVPLPATAGLFLGAVGVLNWMRRRRAEA